MMPYARAASPDNRFAAANPSELLAIGLVIRVKFVTKSLSCGVKAQYQARLFAFYHAIEKHGVERIAKPHVTWLLAYHQPGALVAWSDKRGKQRPKHPIKMSGFDISSCSSTTEISVPSDSLAVFVDALVVFGRATR